MGVLRVKLGVSEDFWDARNVLFLNLGVRVQITWKYSGCKSSGTVYFSNCILYLNKIYTRKKERRKLRQVSISQGGFPYLRQLSTYQQVVRL